MAIVSFNAFASETVRGIVVDATDDGPLSGATVKLVSSADSTKVLGAVSKRGAFEITDVPAGPWKVVISYIGYRKHSATVFVRSQEVDLGTIKLSKDTVNTRTVDVEAEAVAVEIKGDTTEFNSKAYKTNPNANAEDLVRKMPGVTLENGTIKAQGEDVRKVLVDGKEFFGDDPSQTLKNVPADMVDRVQVYDRGTDVSMFSGFDDGNTQKTINLITKPNKRVGQFGKLNGGYGSDERYNTSLAFNHFDGAQRVSALAISNNINQQNFSAQDIIGSMGMGGQMGRMMSRFASTGVGQRMMSTGGSGGGGGGRGDFSNLFVNQQGGITTTHALGLNYSDEWADNMNFSGSYFFNYADNANNSSLDRSYVTPADQLYGESTEASSLSRVHRANMRFEAFLDTLNALAIAPRFTYQGGSRLNTADGTTSNKGTDLSTTQTANTTESTGLVGSGSATYRHRFNQYGRSITMNVRADVSEGNTDGGLLSENTFFGIDSTFALDQRSDQSTKSRTYSGSVAWTEPIASNGLVQISYEPSMTTSNSDKQTASFDSTTSGYTSVDTALTNIFDNTYDVHRAQALFRWQEENTIITVGGAYQYAMLDGEETFPNREIISRTFSNVLPSFMWRQKFSRSSNLRLQYRASTTPPSVSQLQSVVDNTNPTQLRLGNPDLGQDYSHNVTFRYMDADWLAGKSRMAFASLTVTQDYIGSGSVITDRDTIVNGVALPPGAQITRPTNLNGYVSARSYLSYGIPAPVIASNVTFNGGVNYQRVPGMVNSTENIANTTTLRGGFFVGSNMSEDVDYSVGYDGNYNIVVNSLQREQDANYFTHTASARLIWNIGALACSTDVNHTMYTGLGETYDQNYTVWNAGIGYRFLENNAAELRMTVFDLLRQNASVNRTVNDIYVEDSRTSVITRYAMLTFTYDLKTFSSDQPPGAQPPRHR